MGDRGIPKTWRNMDGFGSHTYQWINASGERFWVKYHFKTDQGIDFLTQAEADELAGTSPDHHRKDLHEAIAGGDFPSWTLKVQVMPYADAEGYRFNPFDLTKVWSQQDYPLIEVGTWTLNRNPENFFAQIEQASFEPSNVVPGIGYSPDKNAAGTGVLLRRRAPLPDRYQLRRATGERAKVPVHSYSKEGAMDYTYNAPSVPVYAPNSYGGPHANPEAAGDDGQWAFDRRSCGPITCSTPRTATSPSRAPWCGRC